MNNETTLIICIFISRLIGILEWALLFFLTFEVVICRDARKGNIAKILNSPFAVRWNMFKKSLSKLFYRGTLIIFCISFFAIVSMIGDLWNGRFPRPPYTFTIISLILPLGIMLVYISKGYKITLFEKFHLFIKDQHE